MKIIYADLGKLVIPDSEIGLTRTVVKQLGSLTGIEGWNFNSRIKIKTIDIT